MLHIHPIINSLNIFACNMCDHIGLQNPFDSDILGIPVNDADDDCVVEMLCDVTNEEYSAVMQSLLQERNEPVKNCLMNNKLY